MFRIRFVTAVVAAVFAVAALAQAPASKPTLGGPTLGGPTLEGFDEFAAKQLELWKVPGVAIAVVRDGQVILSKGYGVRNAKEKLPVTPKTLFAIGSTSKAFTAALLYMLAEQGKLDWDKPVREYMPDFRLHDQSATERMTARDLVTHRSGLPRHDLMWYSASFSRKEIYDRLRHLEPSKDFRSTWQYQNLMFMTAGYLAGRLGDLSWEELTRQRILAPLGMNGSNFSVRDSEKNADHARPYQKVKEEVNEVPFRGIDAVGPAGSINSGVDDMSRWVLFHLNRGKHEGKQLLAESAFRDMHSPHMVIPGESPRAELGQSSYGMGWLINTYRGRKVVSHGGGIDGFTALVSFMPVEKLGMVILTNLGGNPLPSVVSYNVYDRLLGLDQIAWADRIKGDQEKSRASEEEAKKKNYTARREGTRPSHELKEYAGEYEHPGYGLAKIELAAGGELKLALHGVGGPLKHFHYDVFEVAEDEKNPFQKFKVMFQTALQGEIESLSLPLESALKPIVFTRVGDKAMREKAFLEPLAGRYTLGPATATIALRGADTLTLTLPGQPTYELAPLQGLKFNIKGLTGFAVEFKKDASGAVNEAAFHQPNGTFVAKRIP